LALIKIFINFGHGY